MTDRTTESWRDCASDPARVARNRLVAKLVLCTDQAECDRLEAKIKEVEAAK